MPPVMPFYWRTHVFSSRLKKSHSVNKWQRREKKNSCETLRNLSGVEEMSGLTVNVGQLEISAAHWYWQSVGVQKSKYMLLDLFWLPSVPCFFFFSWKADPGTVRCSRIVVRTQRGVSSHRGDTGEDRGMWDLKRRQQDKTWKNSGSKKIKNERGGGDGMSQACFQKSRADGDGGVQWQLQRRRDYCAQPSFGAI